MKLYSYPSACLNDICIILSCRYFPCELFYITNIFQLDKLAGKYCVLGNLWEHNLNTCYFFLFLDCALVRREYEHYCAVYDTVVASLCFLLMVFFYINCLISAEFCRCTPSMSRRQLFPDSQQEQYLENDSIYYVERGDSFNCSNFLDVDWISSSGNSCEEETYER